MSNSSALCCSRTRVHAVPGRTEGFIAGLQIFLKALSDRSETLDYAELHITIDGDGQDYYWMGDDRPTLGEPLLASLAAAGEVDLLLNMSSETDCLSGELGAMLSLLADDSLADCVRFGALINDGETISAFLSGMRGGAFHHGTVAFSNGCDGVPADLCWNSSDHRASFTFPGEALDEVWEIADELQARIGMVDLEFSYEDGELHIYSVQLPDLESVEFYRAALERLARLADSAHIGGMLNPESEAAFALLRFALEDGCVKVQTAIAEI